MPTPFDTVGFTSPYIKPASVAPAKQTSQPASNIDAKSADVFTPSGNIDREALKAEVIEEMKKDSLSQEKDLELKKQIKEEIRQELEAENAKKNKLGPIKKFKRFIGTMKKAGATIGEYTKGFFKGAISGGLIGATGFGLCTAAAQVLNSHTNETTNIVQKLLKNPRTAKVVGAIGIIAGMGVQLWNASLKANEKRALIDHKYEYTPTNAGKK